VSLFHIPLRIACTSEEANKDSVGFHTITQMSHNFRYHTKLIYDSTLIAETIKIYRKYIDCTNCMLANEQKYFKSLISFTILS